MKGLSSKEMKLEGESPTLKNDNDDIDLQRAMTKTKKMKWMQFLMTIQVEYQTQSQINQSDPSKERWFQAWLALKKLEQKSKRVQYGARSLLGKQKKRVQYGARSLLGKQKRQKKKKKKIPRNWMIQQKF